MSVPSLEKLFSKSLPSELLIFKESYSFTEEKLKQLRNILEESLKEKGYNKNICIVAVGSYGRYEASTESDMDVYILHKNLDENTLTEVNELIKKVSKISSVRKSRGFKPISYDNMLTNIGGKDDTNDSLTCRILFLLESACLYNQSFYDKAYKSILKKYMADSQGGKLPRFLLNDIIRYYRTICVDYEYKTAVQGKEWAIRNIKLRFSRKALYYGGVVVLLNSINRTKSEEYTAKYLGQPFAEKISHILIKQSRLDRYKEILKIYAYFLNKIGQREVRQHLKNLKREDRGKDSIFKEFTKKSNEFNKALLVFLDLGEWKGKDYREYLIL